MKFVEFTSATGQSGYVNAEFVLGVQSDEENAALTTVHSVDDWSITVPGTPSEVVAKLQGQPQEMNDEAVKLLERWVEWWNNDDATADEIEGDTRALLAKLKGGA